VPAGTPSGSSSVATPSRVQLPHLLLPPPAESLPHRLAPGRRQAGRRRRGAEREAGAEREGRARVRPGWGLRRAERAQRLLRRDAPRADRGGAVDPGFERGAVGGVRREPRQRPDQRGQVAGREEDRARRPRFEQPAMRRHDAELAGRQALADREAPALVEGVVDGEQAARRQPGERQVRDAGQHRDLAPQRRRPFQQAERAVRPPARPPDADQPRHLRVGQAAQQVEPGLEDHQVVLAALERRHEQHEGRVGLVDVERLGRRLRRVAGGGGMAASGTRWAGGQAERGGGNGGHRTAVAC
jgi:hypothetical protein